MADSNGALLRIYCHEDRTIWPDDWPEAMGIACLWKNDRIVAVSPFHDDESNREILDRVLPDLGLSELSIMCHPRIGRCLPAQVTVAQDADISEALEEFLNLNEEAVERAGDFSINYEYALSEGLPLRNVTLPESLTVRQPHPVKQRTHDVPEGFVEFNGPEEAALSVFKGAFVRRSEAGQLELVLPGIENDKVVSDVSVLVRNDGMGIAIAVEQLLRFEVPHGIIELPQGCLPINLRKGERVNAVLIQSDSFLFVTPILHSRRIIQKSQPEAKKKNWLKRTLKAGTVILISIFLLLAFAFFATEDEFGSVKPAQPVSAAEKLKDMMFEDLSSARSQSENAGKVEHLVRRIREKDWVSDLGLDTLVDTVNR